jgi:hypothetical protein
LYRFILAWRYLRSRKITYLSVLGVAVGVTALIVVLAVMEGFQQDFKRRIRGMLSDIVMRYRGDEPLEEVLRKIESVPHVVGAAPRLRGMGLVGAGKGRGAVGTVGIDPGREGKVSQLPVYVMDAWIDRPAAGAIVYFEMYQFLIRDDLEQMKQLSEQEDFASKLAPHIENGRLFVEAVGEIVQHLHENKGFEAIREAYRQFRMAMKASALFGEDVLNIEGEIDTRRKSSWAKNSPNVSSTYSWGKRSRWSPARAGAFPRTPKGAPRGSSRWWGPSSRACSSSIRASCSCPWKRPRPFPGAKDWSRKSVSGSTISPTRPR